MQNDKVKFKILMIDDDVRFLEIYKSRLEREGFCVLTALDGALGLKLGAKEKPDLITLDIVMPGKDGFETLRELKDQKDTKDTPVLMFSTLSKKEYIKRALDSGATEYLVKAHTTPGDLVKKIKAMSGMAPLN
jgi:DNA-binding response OmpR family regulator